jgi:hypothetical protein
MYNCLAEQAKQKTMEVTRKAWHFFAFWDYIERSNLYAINRHISPTPTSLNPKPQYIYK